MAGKENGLRYDAFISYKHEKPDTAVAKDIQRGLEHFRVPKEVQKETGRGQIGRIFRDREELVLTGDLSREIQEALLASRFMILVCSKHTRESVWIEREIDFFLQTHDADHVLTVIIEGEPADVLPQCLLKQGSESLSADYRISRRQANRHELPRIAAALLGCGYDDLIRRARQYRTRRFLAAAFVMSAVFAAAALYFFRSRAQVEKSLKEARVSQARYIAGEVESLLDKDLDVTAAQLALYAVPKDRDRTPAQSIKALSDASGAYLPLTLDPSANIRAVGELKSADTMTCIKQDRSGKQIAAADETGHIHVWDTNTGEDILSFQAEDEIKDMSVTKDMLIVETGEQLSGYSLSSGKKKWSTGRTTIYGDLLKTDENETKLVTLGKDDEGRTYLMSADPEKGTIQNDVALPDEDEARTVALTGDGRYAALCVRAGEAYGIRIYDFEKEKMTETGINPDGPCSLCFLTDGSLVVCGAADGDGDETDHSSLDRLLNTAGKTKRRVYRISPQSGEILWESEISYNFHSGGSVTAGSLTCKGDDGTERNAVYVTAANILSVYDAETGDEIRNYELPGNPLLVGVADEGFSEAGFLTAVCSDGSFVSVDLSGKDIDYMTVFQDDIDGALYCETSDGAPEYFVHPEGSDTLLQYTTNYSDPDFEELSGASGESYPVFCAVTDSSYIVIRDGKEGEGLIMEIYGKETKTLEKSVSVKDRAGTVERFLGLEKDRGEIVYAGEGAAVHAISPEDGTVRTITLPEKPFSIESMLMQEGILYYIDKNGNFCSFNLQTKRADSIKPEEGIDSSVTALARDGSTRRFAVAGGQGIMVFDRNGNEIAEIPYSDAQAVGLYFYKDMLLAACSDGRLIRYALPDGRILGQVELDSYGPAEEADDAGCRWLFREDGTLCLWISDYLNVIDTKEWAVLYSIPQCFCFDPDNRIFLVCASPDTDTYVPGYFPEYTLDDLIRKCREAGGNRDPDEKMLAQYGVSDYH